MSIILESERKKTRAAIFTAALYAALSLGAITMVWPFAVMLSASFSSSYDYHRHSPAVIGLFDRSDRFARFAATLFETFPRDIWPDAPAAWNTWQDVANDAEGRKAFAERELAFARDAEKFSAAEKRARDFLLALCENPPRRFSCRHDPRDVAPFLKAKYGSPEALGEAWGTRYRSFFDVSFSAESKASPDAPPRDDAKFRAWEDLKREYVERAVARGDFVSRTMPETPMG